MSDDVDAAREELDGLMPAYRRHPDLTLLARRVEHLYNLLDTADTACKCRHEPASHPDGGHCQHPGCDCWLFREQFHWDDAMTMTGRWTQAEIDAQHQRGHERWLRLQDKFE